MKNGKYEVSATCDDCGGGFVKTSTDHEDLYRYHRGNCGCKTMGANAPIGRQMSDIQDTFCNTNVIVEKRSSEAPQ